MDEIIERKPTVEEGAAESTDVKVLDQARKLLEVEVAFDETHDSWLSIILFWIQELRWRRAFWEKVGRPSIEESET